MTQKIYRTNRHALAGLAVSFLYIYLVTKLLNPPAGAMLPVIAKLEGVLNISLLVAAFFLIRCLILTFRKRIVLQGGENGLYVHVSRKNRGIIPWRHITHFACSPDGRHLRVYLQGMWDVPDGCGEQFTIRTDESLQRMIPLPLRHKVRSMERVRDELEEWLLYYSDAGTATLPDFDESSQRRVAAVKKRGLGWMLTPLYFLRSKFWILLVVAYLFAAGLIERWTTLSRPTVLGAAVVPVLAIGILLRILLKKAIAALEQSKERNQERSLGL